MPPKAATAPSRITTPGLLWGSKNLTVAARTGMSWLWQGYLAPGAVTLLTSQWKAGKTTLAAVLLARLQTGGQLAGLPLAPGKAVVISEENPEHWHRRSQQLDFGDHVGWFCRPFRGKPRPDEWLALLDRIAELHSQHGLSLVVIDSLAAFLPSRSENDACCMLEALMPLHRLTDRGLSVLAAHHPRKGRSPAGQAARGSGALSAYADILIEMRWHPCAVTDRRRKLRAYSRFPETPRQLVIELNTAGTDYVALGTFAEEEFAEKWQLLQTVLAKAPRKLTRSEIREQWPVEKVPDETTVYRWLEQAVGQGRVCKDGQGLRNSPFRYWLPGREEEWRKDPLAVLFMPELFEPNAAWPGKP